MQFSGWKSLKRGKGGCMELCRAKQLPELPWCPRAGDRSRVRSSTNSSDPADSRERSTQEEFGRGRALGSKPLGAEGAPASPRIRLTQGSSPEGLVAPGAVPSPQLHPSKASDVAWGDPLLPGTAQSLPLAANLLGLPANYPGISTWRRN